MMPYNRLLPYESAAGPVGAAQRADNRPELLIGETRATPVRLPCNAAGNSCQPALRLQIHVDAHIGVTLIHDNFPAHYAQLVP